MRGVSGLVPGAGHPAHTEVIGMRFPSLTPNRLRRADFPVIDSVTGFVVGQESLKVATGALGGQDPPEIILSRPSQYGARSLNFWSFPVAVRTRLVRNSTEVGHL